MVPSCTNQLACPKLPIRDSEKSKSKFGFWGKLRILPNPVLFGRSASYKKYI